MKLILRCAVALIHVQLSESFNLLRHQVVELADKNQPRKLVSVVGGVEIAGSNSRYENYSGSEVPTDQNINDAPDFLRSDDACLKDGSISSGNCPSLPNCNFKGQFGQAKLCINRLPTPAGKWYVAAMVCIPQWENCDKCMCGKITSDTAADAKCAFTGQTPDDDNVKVNCGDLRTAKIDGISLSTPGDENDSSKTSSITTNDESISEPGSDSSPQVGGEKETTGASEQSTSISPKKNPSSSAENTDDEEIDQDSDLSTRETASDSSPQVGDEKETTGASEQSSNTSPEMNPSSSVGNTDDDEIVEDSVLDSKKSHSKGGKLRRNK